MDYLSNVVVSGINLYSYCGNDPVNYYDPSGHITLTAIIIIGLIGLGALTGFGTIAKIDSKDGRMFNGDVGWEAYVGGTLFGGCVGGLIGYYAAPTISIFLSSTGGAIGGFAFAGGLGSTGGAIAISNAGAIALAGSIALTEVGIVSGALMFSKPNSGRIRFSDDDIGIDPKTGEEVTQERVREVYKSIKDPIKKAKWKKWMKGKGWRRCHLG